MKARKSAMAEAVAAWETRLRATLAVALDYQSKGWSLITLSPGKKVKRQRWKPNQTRRMTIGEIEKLWSLTAFGIGIVTGAISGNLAVIDIEAEHLDHFKAHVGELETRTVRSGRGGAHFYTVASGLVTSGRLYVGGVHVGEVSGRGHYVVAPPTWVPEGRYELVEDLPLMPTPIWAIERERRPGSALVPRTKNTGSDSAKSSGTPNTVSDAAEERPPEDTLPTLGERRRRARAYVAQMPAATEGKMGSLACYGAAVAVVRGFCLSSDDALAVLRDVYNPRCKPPWSIEELRYKVERAGRKSILPWRYLVDQDVGDDAVDNGGICLEVGAATHTTSDISSFCPRPVAAEELIRHLPPKVRAAAETGWRAGGSYADADTLAWTITLCAVRARHADIDSVRDLLMRLPGGQPLRDTPDPDKYMLDLYGSVVRAFETEIADTVLVKLLKIVVMPSKLGKPDAAQVIAYVQLDLGEHLAYPYTREVGIVLGDPHRGELSGDWLELLAAFPTEEMLHRFDPFGVTRRDEIAGARTEALAVYRSRRVTHLLPTIWS